MFERIKGVIQTHKEIKELKRENKERENFAFEQNIEVVNGLIDLQFIQEEAGRKLISQIESHKVGFKEIRLEIKNLLNKRLSALEVMKDDPSLEESKKEEIIFLHAKLTLFMAESDLSK
jgi:hypothetical protein